MLESIVVEKAILAKELTTVSPKMHQNILKLLEGIEIEYIDNEKLKEATKSARAIIRTGEFTPYPSVILVAGCAYCIFSSIKLAFILTCGVKDSDYNYHS